MDREEVMRAVIRLAQEVLPDTAETEIRAARSLTDLGATSMDRAEITVGVMEALGLALPPAAFLGIGTIAELVELLWSHARAARG